MEHNAWRPLNRLAGRRLAGAADSLRDAVDGLLWVREWAAGQYAGQSRRNRRRLRRAYVRRFEEQRYELLESALRGPQAAALIRSCYG